MFKHVLSMFLFSGLLGGGLIGGCGGGDDGGGSAGAKDRECGVDVSSSCLRLDIGLCSNFQIVDPDDGGYVTPDATMYCADYSGNETSTGEFSTSACPVREDTIGCCRNERLKDGVRYTGLYYALGGRSLEAARLRCECEDETCAKPTGSNFEPW